MIGKELSENALEVAKARYFINGETWETCTHRVAKTMASIETSPMKYTKEFHEILFNQDFMCAGRIFRNAGRPKGSMFNCYVLPIGDSIEEIGQFYKESLILWSEGGGIGCNFSPLRPKGDKILGKGGVSSGLVSFLEGSDFLARSIESGGSRRAAALACVEIAHPEVLDFMDAKLIDGKLSYFNISVGINNNFLELVESDKDWEFKFKQKIYGKMKARDIWKKILNNMVNKAEPGLLNFSNLMKNNSYYYDPVVSTNPCITGETLIAVADGRVSVSIKQLVEEKKDVPVYCCDENENIYIRTARNPRKTGKNLKVYKVILDDGSFVRATKNHKFILKTGKRIELENLKIGDSLMPYNRQQFNNGKMYWQVGNKGEHTIIASYLYGEKDHSYLVHHKDENGLNNSWNNLEWLTRGEHNLVHPSICERTGKLNGMFGKNHSKESKQKMREKIIKYFEDPLNKAKQKEAAKKAMTLDVRKKISIAKTKERIIIQSKCKQCNTIFDQKIIKGSKYKSNFCTMKCKNTYASSFRGPITNETREKMSIKAKKYSNSKEGKKARRKAANISCMKQAQRCGNCLLSLGLEIKKKTWDLNKDIIKNCEIKTFISSEIITKMWNDNWNRFIEESENYNHKIVSIIEDGYEDVYNITVDEFHNYGIITNPNAKSKKKGYPKLTGLFLGNCGEAVLANHDICDLGSLVLPNFITGNVNTNWKKLESTIKLAIRFLDNVLDINKYVLTQNDIKAHNSRRIGLGIMGLADYLFAKKIKYGSGKSITEIEKLVKFIRDCSYQASVELAIEKGAFPKFDSIPYLKASFVRKLPVSMRMDIKKNGIRNVTLLSYAPTGTISLIAETTSGIEPLFSKAHMRNDRVSSRLYIHPLYKKFIENNEEIPDWFVDSYDIKPQGHLEIQSCVQKYVDAAVSKTINLPVETTEKDLDKLLLEFIKDLKGVTVYRDQSKGDQILKRMELKDIKNYLNKKDDKIELSVGMESVGCANGKCEI